MNSTGRYSPWLLHISEPSNTNFRNIEVGRDFVDKPARFLHDLDLQDVYSPTLLEFIGIKQMRGNMLSDIALDESCLHPCNISNIIYEDNGL